MNRVLFTINGKQYSAGHELSVDTTLTEFIRRYAELRGTKYMCLEGGCGACVVNVRARRPPTGELVTFSVNSCLVAVLSCEDWDITTVEGIGSRNKGYNIIQKRLNNYFGSQCGYCSPGFVMSMYSLVQSNEHHLTEKQVEKSFGSNLCRCTGYRPILEAFKSFAVDPDPKVINKIKDIEDVDNLVCPKSGKKCGGIWAYPIKFYPKLLIDINNVTELRSHYVDVNLVLGANMTLTDTINLFNELSKSNEDFWYLNILRRHLEQVAHIPVRNISPKEQNAHAEVNSAFLFKLDPKSHIVLKASIVYGGINPSFTHAYDTEKKLIGCNIFSNKTLQEALHCLEKEINPDFNPPEPLPFYRKKLALALFYKCIIKLCPREILDPKYASGATTAYEDRPPVSRSYQEYDTNKADYPITQPLLKKEGLIQCAGEAKYTDDVPTIIDEVFASFVVSTVAKGEIESIDYSDVLKIDGVIAVYTSKDIPGVNSIVRGDFQLLFENEEVLASEKIFYYNQPVAIVVAESQVLADKVSYLVKVKYKNLPKKPVIFTIQDAIEAPPLENRLVPYPGITPTDRGANVQKVIKGKFCSPRQYHNMMELHTSITRPVDNGYEIDTASQWMDITQAAIAQFLKIPENLIVVRTRRCGGAFGCKIARQMFTTCATALAAYKLNRPCRMAMRMPDIMRITGKRPNSRLDYEVGVDGNGQIQYMDATVYVNDGMSKNENENTYVTDSIKNCYNPDRWKVDSFGPITDAPTNCFMRAPGAFEGIAAIEHIMEHVAAELKKDPIQVRFANYRINDNQLPDFIPMFLNKTEYYQRQEYIKEFNLKHRWKKRALRLNNMAFPAAYLGNYGALVSICHGDGSVVVNIGGIEIGQGINTKIAQVAANEFKIPVEKVAILAHYSFTTPNNFATASSITTECCALAVQRCCQQILLRLAPVRAAMPTATWEEVVFQADLQGILLQANYQASPNDPRLVEYPIFGIATTEVEIDILTGTKWIVRADIFEDVGRSLNPALDVGQPLGNLQYAWVTCSLILSGKRYKHPDRIADTIPMTFSLLMFQLLMRVFWKLPV
ncbi:hypothetical protein MSG28_011097 [Choristoneura fumiferana]|uniref:Uncharacterized protein n=1 Tax=Choristoneura fumiferana TaxID=7141 RepID=A0ACC0KQC1_CHOFU|nr:hypothetical protein MSG28_011097 [Choristoneura fumiferana]